MAVSSSFLTVSVNKLGLHLRLSDKSLNKSKPNIEPWGTPALMLTQECQMHFIEYPIFIGE